MRNGRGRANLVAAFAAQAFTRAALARRVDTHARVVVVGGGIFGLGTAYALARAGFGHVQVLERSQLGSGSTAYAAGILSLHTWHDGEAALILRTRQLIEELVAWGQQEELAAAATAWHPVGAVTIASSANRARLEQMHARMRRLRLGGDFLDAAQAQGKYPHLQFDREEVALTSLEDGYVESTDLVELLRARSKALGVRFREGVDVTHVSVADGRADGVAWADGRERADHVVVAGGAWTPGLLARSGFALPAIPYRTQLSTLEFPHADRVPVLHDTAHHFYTRPESATRMLAGDGTQLRRFSPDAFNRAADGEFIESIARRVVERFRDGGQARYRTGWAGLCVGTPDKRPLAGAVPGADGLCVLTGDNGFGLMRGLALGEVTAAAVEGRKDERLTELSPARFGSPPPQEFALAEGFSYPD